MALVERHSEHHARQRHGSHESLAAAERPAAPASDGRAQTPERRFNLERHPLAKLALKAGGIALLLLGLAGIGAISMKKGFGLPKLALADTTHPASSSGGAMTQASLLDGAPSAAPSTSAPAASAVSARPAALTEDGRVILNLATVDDLRHLPGVGQKRAEAILALRQKLGKFKRPSDLLRIRGIGSRRLKQLLPKLVVDAPVPAGGPASATSASPKATAPHAPVPPAASPAPPAASPVPPAASPVPPAASPAPPAASPAASSSAAASASAGPVPSSVPGNAGAGARGS